MASSNYPDEVAGTVRYHLRDKHMQKQNYEVRLVLVQRTQTYSEYFTSSVPTVALHGYVARIALS